MGVISPSAVTQFLAADAGDEESRGEEEDTWEGEEEKEKDGIVGYGGEG